MDKDIKQIGYGVKINRLYVSNSKVTSPGFEQAQFEFETSHSNVTFTDIKDEAYELAKQSNGKVVELYAREVDDDISKDD